MESRYSEDGWSASNSDFSRRGGGRHTTPVRDSEPPRMKRVGFWLVGGVGRPPTVESAVRTLNHDKARRQRNEEAKFNRKQKTTIATGRRGGDSKARHKRRRKSRRKSRNGLFHNLFSCIACCIPIRPKSKERKRGGRRGLVMELQRTASQQQRRARDSQRYDRHGSIEEIAENARFTSNRRRARQQEDVLHYQVFENHSSSSRPRPSRKHRHEPRRAAEGSNVEFRSAAPVRTQEAKKSDPASDPENVKAEVASESAPPKNTANDEADLVADILPPNPELGSGIPEPPLEPVPEEEEENKVDEDKVSK